MSAKETHPPTEADEENLRVVDRRRFSQDGSEREGVEARPPRDGPDLPPEAHPRAQPRREPIDFASFVASLATNALAAMGAIPESQAEGVPRNPELAREYVDILSMLQDKTRGNLTPTEERVLQSLLTELRMRFVQAKESS